MADVLRCGHAAASRGWLARWSGAAGALGPGAWISAGSGAVVALENLSNDLFDADTGIDTTAKPHSVVALLGRRRPVRRLSTLVLLAGLLMMLLMALQSSISVLALVLVSCGIGYLYQGPPFRLGYLGLGEPLCWLAFGPFATAAALVGGGSRSRDHCMGGGAMGCGLTAGIGSRSGHLAGAVLLAFPSG